jgi:hypothetical protein
VPEWEDRVDGILAGRLDSVTCGMQLLSYPFQGTQVVADTLIGSSSGLEALVRLRGGPEGSSGSSTSSGGLAEHYRKDGMKLRLQHFTRHIDIVTVVAAIQMGNPSHITGLSLNKGTSTMNGVSESPD